MVDYLLDILGIGIVAALVIAVLNALAFPDWLASEWKRFGHWVLPVDKRVSRRLVRHEFTFSDPDARRVFVAGTFNAWLGGTHRISIIRDHNFELKRDAEGVWRRTVALVPEREYQ